MKKIYKKLSLLFAGLLITIPSFSVIHNVVAANGAFTPNTLNVNVGDTIHWQLSGIHTSTSTSVPAGAATWDSQVVQSFEYVVTVAGPYSYVCTPHGFTGQFTATGSSGISTPVISYNFGIFAQTSSTINVVYSIPHFSDVKISLYDVTGKAVKVLTSLSLTAGEYSESYNLDDIRKGIYLVEFVAGNQRFVKRILID